MSRHVESTSERPAVDAEDTPEHASTSAERASQFQHDARWQVQLAANSMEAVRQRLDRAAAGVVEAEFTPPEAPIAETTTLPVFRTPVHSSVFLAFGASLVLLVGLVAFNEGTLTRTLQPSPAQASLSNSAAASASVGPSNVTAITAAAASTETDLGRTIYAARFAAAPAGERRCLARAVYYEARGEAMDGQMAVAQVILNRARAHKWPNSICGVVNQGVERGEKCQFSFACFTHLSEPSGELWEQAKLVADQAVAGQAWLRELTEATHYHTTSVAPVWRVGLVPPANIGTHIFYREPDGLRVAAADPAAYAASAVAADGDIAKAKAAAVAKATARLKAASAAVGVKRTPSDDGWKATVFGQ
jgi:spore germination cell wall hydrolase CwlJ-like protein